MTLYWLVILVLTTSIARAKQFTFMQDPIVIKTGLYNTYYPTDYDAINHKFVVANGTFVIVYDILGSIKGHHNQKVMFDTTVSVSSIRFYEFSISGHLIGTYPMY